MFSVLRYSKKIKKKKEVVGQKLKGECLRLQQCERKKVYCFGEDVMVIMMNDG